jgi:hypothetical protein
MWLIILVCAIVAFMQLDWLEDKKEREQQEPVTFWVQVRKQ